MKRGVKRDQGRFQFYHHHYGVLNSPISQRLERRAEARGQRGKRPIPHNVDPETGEIKTRSLLSKALDEVIGQPLSPAQKAWQDKRPRVYGSRLLYGLDSLLPSKPLGKVGRIITLAVLGITIIVGTVVYQHNAQAVEARRQAWVEERQEQREQYQEWFNSLTPEEQQAEQTRVNRLKADLGRRE